MDKLFKLVQDLFAEFYQQGVSNAVSWFWQAITTVLSIGSISFISNSMIPEQLLKDTQLKDTQLIANVTTITWEWGIPFFVIVAFFCGVLLRWVESSTYGVPHAEIRKLRRLYFLLHVVSTVIVTCGLALFLAGMMRDLNGGLPVQFWIILTAVAVTYSTVFVFIAAWLLPRPVRIAMTYAILHGPLVFMGF